MAPCKHLLYAYRCKAALGFAAPAAPLSRLPVSISIAVRVSHGQLASWLSIAALSDWVLLQPSVAGVSLRGDVHIALWLWAGSPKLNLPLMLSLWAFGLSCVAASVRDAHFDLIGGAHAFRFGIAACVFCRLATCMRDCWFVMTCCLFGKGQARVTCITSPYGVPHICGTHSKAEASPFAAPTFATYIRS